MRRWENYLPASLLPIWVLNLSTPPPRHSGITPSPPQGCALLPHFQGQDIPKVADIWILTYFLWLHIKQVLLPCCPVPVLISLVGPVSFPRLPPWVSLHSLCQMAHFFLPKALANGFLWDKWLRPCYPFTDLFPSAWSCECCPIQNLPCHWEGSTTRTHVLECFFIRDHLSELSAGIVLCYCCALPGHHALPQPGPPLATATTKSVPKPLFCRHRRKAPFPGPWNSPICPTLLHYLIMSRRIQTWGVLLFNHPPCSSLKAALFSGAFDHFTFSVTSNSISLDCYYMMLLLPSLQTSLVFLDPVSILSLPSTKTVAGLDYFHPADRNIFHKARLHAGAVWLRIRS